MSVGAEVICRQLLNNQVGRIAGDGPGGGFWRGHGDNVRSRSQSCHGRECRSTGVRPAADHQYPSGVSLVALLGPSSHQPQVAFSHEELCRRWYAYIRYDDIAGHVRLLPVKGHSGIGPHDLVGSQAAGNIDRDHRLSRGIDGIYCQGLQTLDAASHARAEDGVYYQVAFFQGQIRAVHNHAQVIAQSLQNFPIPLCLLCGDIPGTAQEIDGYIKADQVAGGDKGIAAVIAAACHNGDSLSLGPGHNLPSESCARILHELQGQQAEISAIGVESCHLFCRNNSHSNRIVDDNIKLLSFGWRGSHPPTSSLAGANH